MRALCEVKLKDRIGVKDLMTMLRSNEAMNLLAKT